MTDRTTSVLTLPDLGMSLSRRDAMTNAIRTGRLQELPWAVTQAPLAMPAGALIDGRYELGERIGAGGFGAVFDGHDRLTGRRVAIKVIQQLSLPRRRRMLQEIAVLRRLDLPCVVGFVDEGDLEGDRPYVVMPFVEGESYPGLDHDGTWTTLGPRVLALAETLARVHAAGVLHRDLKPENVLWVRGAPMLLDFGLAESESLRIEPDDELAGSPAYLAPEQYLGSTPTERSDLFSLGVLLYETLCGELPFAGSAAVDVITQLLTQEPVPLHERADVPAAVSDLVWALLRKDPDLRLPSAAYLVRALRPHVPDPDGLPRDLSGPAAVDLERAFTGPEIVHHLRSDPARVLWRRTGGRAEAVRAALGAWVRAGVATPTGDGRLALTRDAADRLLAGMPVDPCRGGGIAEEGMTPSLVALWTLVETLSPWASLPRLASVLGVTRVEVEDRLAELAERGLVAPTRTDDETVAWFATRTPPRLDGALHFRLLQRVAEVVPPDSDARLRHLVASGRMDDLPAVSQRVAEARRAEGRQRAAWVAARAGMVAERRMGTSSRLALELAAQIALTGSMRHELGVVELEARRRGDLQLAELCALALRVLSDHDGGHERLAQLDLSHLPSLEHWPLRLTAYVMQRADIRQHEAFVEAQRGRLPEAMWSRYAARVAMRKGELNHAAQLAEASLASLDGAAAHAGMLNAASLWLEAGGFERAEELLDDVQQRLKRSRSGITQAYGMHLRRSLAYRRGDVVPASDELLEAIEHLGIPMWSGPSYFLEMAAAWRRNDEPRMLHALRFLRTHIPTAHPVRLLADAFAAMARVVPWQELDLAVRADGRSVPPGIRVQAYACLAAVGGPLDADTRRLLVAEAGRLDYPPSARRELLTAREVLMRLEAER